ncbi:MAG: DUF4388 domain-containing protein [Candidatus Latescibacterota bacterium]|nr:MAG: DUF4388 domain-containing protein [Candidatus Latescibacterota bacterium]
MPDLKGNLAVFQPISVMQMLNLAEATGELRLVVESNSARLYFEGGNVTYAGISSRPVKLGEYLVKEGLIEKKTLDEVLEKRPRRRKRIGTLLIEAGCIQEAELRTAIEEQIKEVIYEVVRWQNGSFSFRTGKKPAAQDVRIDIPLDHLMLEGLKRLDEERENTR